MEVALYYVVLLCMVGYFWNDKLALAHIQTQKAYSCHQDGHADIQWSLCTK